MLHRAFKIFILNEMYFHFIINYFDLILFCSTFFFKMLFKLDCPGRLCFALSVLNFNYFQYNYVSDEQGFSFFVPGLSPQVTTQRGPAGRVLEPPAGKQSTKMNVSFLSLSLSVAMKH